MYGKLVLEFGNIGKY